MLRGLSICLGTLIFLGFAANASAEVSVRTDRRGGYLATQVIYSSRFAPNRVWGVQGRGGRHAHALNPYGDANGDLWPTIAESPRAPYLPWVVWSRFSGADYDLAWSRWTSAGWSPVMQMFDDGAAGDDLDADLAFDAEGRPVAAWWRDEPGGGRVYISVFLNRGWSTPYPVSEAGRDSRLPSVTVQAGNAWTIEYETPEGTVSQLIVLDLPGTITDDINPQNYIHLKGAPFFVGQSRP